MVRRSSKADRMAGADTSAMVYRSSRVRMFAPVDMFEPDWGYKSDLASENLREHSPERKREVAAVAGRKDAFVA